MFIQANIMNPEILLILLVIFLLIFGGSKIPELAKGLGQGMKEFKTAMKEDDAPKTEVEKKDSEKSTPA